MTIDDILCRAKNKQRLTIEDAINLYESSDLEKIGAAANEVMKSWHPDPITTFVIGRNINYTNICDTYCRFCAFQRPVSSSEGYVLETDVILEKIKETVEAGGTEILMQGGTHPGLPFQYYVDLMKTIKSVFPSITLHCFSPAEIFKMAEISQFSIEEVLTQLKGAGLDSVPGGGAEILDNRTRKKISRNKGTWQEWIECMKTVKKVGMHATATMVIGFGESFEERALHLQRIRDAQDETNCFLAFISWTFQPDHTRLKAKKVQPEEYLKNLAISRLFIDNIPNFQTSWVTMGPEVGKRSLFFGCNDFGSTMMEENVVAATGVAYKVNADGIKKLIREAGKIPAKRNTKYEILSIYDY
ncbi:MAG: dehypoxanthine futalosine cyclase [Bacillaceae bacterium]|nr:dehypoxanthine futalosine cyclase [Bacillaceae bacterium]